MIWVQMRNLGWLFITSLAVFAFMAPTDVLEAITNMEVVTPNATIENASGSTLPTYPVDKGNAELFMETISVIMLLFASFIPSMTYMMGRFLAFVSFMLSLIYWCIVIIEDEFDVIEPWFSLSFLVILQVVPLLSGILFFLMQRMKA